MSTNTISDLRDVLFETLRGLKDNTIEVDRARAINETAQTIINSAKAEVDHLRVVGGTDTGFISGKAPALPAPGGETQRTPLPDGTEVVTQKPGVRITQHRLRG